MCKVFITSLYSTLFANFSTRSLISWISRRTTFWSTRRRVSNLPRSIRNFVDPPSGPPPSHLSLLHFIHEVSKKKNRSQERSVTLINSSLHPSHPGKYFYRPKEKNLVNKKKIKRTRIIPDLFSFKKKRKTNIHNFKTRYIESWSLTRR